MNAQTFSLKSINKVSFYLLLVGVMLSGLGINKISAVSAQAASTETSAVAQTETPTPFSVGAETTKLSIVSAATINLPIFELPYGWDSDIPQTYEPVYWSGGLHKYGDLNTADIIPANLGSGLDFSAGQDYVFDSCNRQCSFIVRSMAPGTVIYMTQSPDGQGSDSFGKEIAVKSDVGGSVIIYGHLYNFFPGLSVGSHVNRESTLGRAGHTHAASVRDFDIHLHVELRDGANTCTQLCLGVAGSPDHNLGGNPLSWNNVRIGDYTIFAYFDSADQSTNAYNYDGVAVDTASLSWQLKNIDDLKFTDLGYGHNPRTAHTRVPDNFSCELNTTDCEKNNNFKKDLGDGSHIYSNFIVFSGHGQFGGGGVFAPPSCPQSGGVILYYNANYDCNGQSENNGYVQRSSAGWQNITGGMNENASSVKMPAGWSVMLYENTDRSGGRKCLNSTDSLLSDFNYLGNFPNTSVSVADHASSFEVFTTTGCTTGGTTPQPTPAPGDGIEVCDTTNYGAPCKLYTYSNNTCTNLTSDGWNNKIESLRFKGAYVGGYDIILYDDSSCGVYIARYGSDASSLGMLNNLTGSLRVEQHVPPVTPTANPGDGIDLCDGTNWGGECRRYTYTNDSYCVDLNATGWANRADSLRFIGTYVSNYDLILYHDSACGTYYARYGTDEPDLGSFKNQIASIRIEKHITQNPTYSGGIDLCDGSNYGQPCQRFTYVGNDYCTNLQPFGWDNRANSLKFIDQYVGKFDVILYDDNGCNIYNARYGSDATDLGAFNDKIGSIRIEKHGDPKPDLIPYPRPGRSAPVVISSVSGTTTNNTLYVGEPVFIDWGDKNNGSANALAHNVKLTIDGQMIIDYPFGGLNSGGTNGFDDWSTTWDTPGTFTVSLAVDPYSAVDEADEGNNVWTGQFTWVLRQPNQFNKSAPINGTANQPLALSLNWTNSSGVNSYQYCYDTSNNNNCDTGWNDVGTSTNASLSGLNPGTTYYWHVRASNNGGSTYADGNTWWAFSTVPSVPNDDFNNATQPIVLPYTRTQTTTGATSAGDDPTFPCVMGTGYNTVWYKYVPTANGRVTINTFDSSFDTVLGVWSGNRGSLLSQACNDDTLGLQSEVQLQVVGGTPYYIEVAGYSQSSHGSLHLAMSPAAGCPSITAWKGEYWANQSLSGSPTLCRNDLDINFAWGGGSPDPSIPNDHFSARWTRTIYFDTAIYRFHIDHDDGARLYIDNILVPGGDFSNTCCQWDSVDKQLPTGNHVVQLEMFEIDGSANVQLWWERVGSSGSNGADTTGVFRPSNGLLYLKNTNDTGFADMALNYGLPGDYPVVGDWDGNGTTTIGIYRKDYFYLRNSNTIGFADLVFTFGQTGDQPIAGDWNGDGIDTIGVYRPSNGQFLMRNSNSAGPAEMSFFLGNVGDVGVAGDWNGDGIDTTGVFRPANGLIYLKDQNTTGFADYALNYGLAGDKPVMGDWNNDGIDTIGIYRNGSFYLRNSNTIGFAELIFALGNPGDMPIAGNWDGLP